jgi:Fic family protein
MTKQPCIPDELPIEDLNWRKLVPLIAQANQEVARFDGALKGMVNPEVLLSPIMVQEAVLSSRIEGTQATLAEVLQHEAGEQFSEEKRGDIQEVMNYRRALKIGVDYLKERPISLSLIRELHAILMDSVRGKDKEPGRFREDQNWIGPKGCPIEKARFVPPNPLLMKDFLQKLEAFISSDYDDRLIQLAVIHAQFEIIHPFKDGNGRLGRMLVPLFLYQKRVIERPVFYLSEYLEQHDEEYRARLLAITEEKDWQGWIEFFLRGLIEQSISNIRKADDIHQLYEKMKIIFQEFTHSQFSIAALDAFFTLPILKSSDFAKISGVAKPRANAILAALREKNVIHCLTEASGRRGAVYTLPHLINAAEGREIFVSAEN